ncbi:MAG: hypothetical protein R3B72_46975 [Polyangiaceae bacterium]
MKKVLIGAAVLVALGAGITAAIAVTRSPEEKICMRLGDLCGAEGTYSDLERCAKDIAEIEKAVGDKRMGELSECIDDVDSCVAATGCIAGTGLDVMGDMAGEFLKGFERSRRGK